MRPNPPLILITSGISPLNASREVPPYVATYKESTERNSNHDTETKAPH
jgi:hypothetical protein